MRIAFFGTPEFGRTVLASLLEAGEEVVLVVSQPDQPRQRRGKGPDQPSAVKAFAGERGLPVITPRSAGDAASDLTDAKPDICIVAAYGQILPESVLELAGGRWLNVHASRLPAYRGASPVSQAIADGLPETGVTIMEVVPELDAGPIVAQVGVPIDETDTTGSLSEKLAIAGGRLLVKTLPRYQAGKIAPKPQDPAAVSVTHTLRKADGKIDWSRSASDLARFVRAMQPWPGAWTTLDGTQLTVTEAQATDGAGTPGSFTATPPLAVATGDGKLIINRLIPSGRNEMGGGDWLRGVRQAGHFDT